MANLPGWPYWKVVSITGQAGSGTDYQVELSIGDSAGGDFHLEGHCTNFPQDIRITDDDGTTLLDHFVEDLTADPIVVHVEVKDDLGSNQEVRVYYGKSGETTASDGANTFIQYHGAATATYHDTNDFSPTAHFVYETKAKTDVSNKVTRHGLANQAEVATGDGWTIYRWSDAIFGIHAHDNGVATYDSEAIANSAGTFYSLKMTFDGTTLRGYFEGNEIDNGVTSGFPDTNLGLFMSEDIEADEAAGEQKYSFVRKYNSPEPAFSSAEAEQSPTGVSPTGVFYGPLIGPFGGPI